VLAVLPRLSTIPGTATNVDSGIGGKISGRVANPAISSRNAVVVDADPNVAAMTCGKLEKLGWIVSVEHVLACSDSDSFPIPRILVTSFTLGAGVNGFDFSSNGRHQPSVDSHGSSDGQLPQKPKGLGGPDVFLPKPMSMSALEATIAYTKNT
jgi:hypothetical protein